MKTSKAAQKNYYDRTFEKKFAPGKTNFSDDTKYLVERFLDTSVGPGAKKVLEIGCGNGFLTFFLLKKYADITAVDISGRAIENMRDRFSEEIGRGKFKPKCADILEFLKHADEKYDAIIGSGIVHHIEKASWSDLFHLSYENLAPNGIFACGPEPNAGGLYRFCWPFAKFFYRLFGMDYNWEVEKGTLDMIPKDLKLALEKAGFQDPEILPYQAIPRFHLKFLEYIDKQLTKRIKGKRSFYFIVKGKNLKK